MPNAVNVVKREFISDDTIEVAKQMGAYKDIRLGFIMDNIHYHYVEYDTHRKGYWAVKVDVAVSV